MPYYNSTPPGKAEDVPLFLEVELSKIAESINVAPKHTDVQFKSQDSVVNGRGKSEGVPVWDSTLKKPVWPTGNSKEAVWVDGTGAVVYSPI